MKLGIPLAMDAFHDFHASWKWDGGIGCTTTGRLDFPTVLDEIRRKFWGLQLSIKIIKLVIHIKTLKNCRAILGRLYRLYHHYLYTNPLKKIRTDESTFQVSNFWSFGRTVHLLEGIIIIIIALPSGKLSHSYGKSPCYSSVNPRTKWQCSIVFCMFTRG